MFSHPPLEGGSKFAQQISGRGPVTIPSPALQNRRKDLKQRQAKSLPANATEAERRLWSLLRAKQMGHIRFRRQQPIGPYIADFFCSAAKLVVELDGDQHSRPEAVAD